MRVWLVLIFVTLLQKYCIWALSSEFVSSSIPSWQILTAHALPFREARDLAFCLKVPLESLLVWASSGGSGESARMRRLAWTFAARIGDKYQILLTRSIWYKQCRPRPDTRECFFLMGCWALNWEIFSLNAHTCEPGHEKTCLREFLTRSDSNWPAQIQKLAWGLKFWV